MTKRTVREADANQVAALVRLRRSVMVIVVAGLLTLVLALVSAQPLWLVLLAGAGSLLAGRRLVSLSRLIGRRR